MNIVYRNEDPWARACADIADEAGLTAREAEVFTLLSRGRTVSYIAKKLAITPNTAKGYTKSVYAKTCIHSRQDLIDLTEARIAASEH